MSALVLMPMVVLTLAVTACSSNKPTVTPAAAAGQLIEKGLKAQAAGNNQGAINDFQTAVADDPTDTYAYYDLGVIDQTKLNEPNQAAAEYNKALLANPNYRPALYNLAILETPTNPQGAIKLYNEIIGLNANDADALFNVGLLLEANGEPTQGQADLTKAIMLVPSLASRVPKGVTP
jgi:tetratricopeptide (TPR) repeat protein